MTHYGIFESTIQHNNSHWIFKQHPSIDYENYVNSPIHSKIFFSSECLSFTVQNDACTESDTRRLFSHSSFLSGQFLCADQKSFRSSPNEHDLEHHKYCSLEANFGPIFNLHKSDVETWSVYCTNTCPKLGHNTLRIDFTVKQEASRVQQENLKNKNCLNIYRFWAFLFREKEEI